MTPDTSAFSRRRFLFGAIAAAAAPSTVLAQDGRDPSSQKATDMNIRMTFDNQSMTGTLYDNPSARDFFSMLPLDLSIENFGGNEKIAYLPRKLTRDGSGQFHNEQPGDICYFAPWGNLALFYGAYSYSSDLIRLGRFTGGHTPLLTRGKFPLRIERA